MKYDRLCIVPQDDEKIKNIWPLVMCKDCKWWGSHGATSVKWLPCQVTSTRSNWFCADGERKNEEE